MSELTADPGDVLSERPKAATREQRVKTVMDKMPGHISWATDRANFSGCRELGFGFNFWSGLSEEDEKAFVEQIAGRTLRPQELANLYFSHRANLLTVDRVVDGGGIYYLVTTQLDEEDLEEFEETQRRVNFEMREWRAKKEAEKEKQQEQIRENMRLIEVGKKAETYGWAKAAKERDEYKATNAELRRQLEEYEGADLAD